MKLLLLRHGATEATERRLYCGKTDLPLSLSGRRELLRLKEKGIYLPMEGYRILTSGMLRCEQTLALLCGDVPHEQNRAFREMDFGDFEMHSYQELQNDPAYREWISGDYRRNLCPGGESGVIQKARVLTGLRELIHQGRDTLLITHGGVISILMEDLFPDVEKNRFQWQPKPGSGYLILLDRGRNHFLPLG